MKKQPLKLLLPCLFSFIYTINALANVYFVAGKTGLDRNMGTISSPFKTIQKAAAILNAGDTCYIREATYREFVQPENGGTSENNRIAYLAYPGETPVLKGSERISSWTDLGSNIYKAEIPNTFFGGNNPFSTNLNDPNNWIWYGKEYHLGAVYVNGVSYNEMLKQEDVNLNARSFQAIVNDLTTTIYINYSGSSSPNIDLTEINVRPIVIQPKHRGNCNYITLDGLIIQHGSTNWSSNEGIFDGMIDINASGWWIIQNCHISDGRTCGVQAGMSLGHHLIRNNLIERFGQAGLVGNNGGWFASLVEGNIFQDINIKDEFGGAETAAFKAHNVVDLTIKNNIFRRIKVHRNGWAFAIWLDWRTQGNRITGNVFSDIQTTAAIEIECSHGPNLVDNNIFAFSSDTSIAVKHNSSNVIIAHNLFFKANDGTYTTNVNYIEFYIPHTTKISGGDSVVIGNNKSYNNIFIGGSNNMPNRNGNACDNNAYILAAAKCNWGDKNSYNNPGFETNVNVLNTDTSTVVSFDADIGTSIIKCPLISNSFIGKCSPTEQRIENPNSTPITIITDIIGLKRNNNPKVGPIENLINGTNILTLKAGIRKTSEKKQAII